MHDHIFLKQQKPISKPHIPILLHAYARSARPLGVAGRRDGEREESVTEEDMAGVFWGETIPPVGGMA